jgi:hypothetical protein
MMGIIEAKVLRKKIEINYLNSLYDNFYNREDGICVLI